MIIGVGDEQLPAIGRQAKATGLVETMGRFGVAGRVVIFGSDVASVARIVRHVDALHLVIVGVCDVDMLVGWIVSDAQWMLESRCELLAICIAVGKEVLIQKGNN